MVLSGAISLVELLERPDDHPNLLSSSDSPVFDGSLFKPIMCFGKGLGVINIFECGMDANTKLHTSSYSRLSGRTSNIEKWAWI